MALALQKVDVLTVDQAVDSYELYLRTNKAKTTVSSFGYSLRHFKEFYSGSDIWEVTLQEIVEFLDLLTDGLKPATKASRKAQISGLYTHVIDNYFPGMQNPCSTPLIRKLFKVPRIVSPNTYDKEVIEEIIYSAQGRDRLFIECMARTGMRVGEVSSLFLLIPGMNIRSHMNTFGDSRLSPEALKSNG